MIFFNNWNFFIRRVSRRRIRKINSKINSRKRKI